MLKSFFKSCRWKLRVIKIKLELLMGFSVPLKPERVVDGSSG